MQIIGGGGIDEHDPTGSAGGQVVIEADLGSGSGGAAARAASAGGGEAVPAVGAHDRQHSSWLQLLLSVASGSRTSCSITRVFCLLFDFWNEK